MTKLVEDMGADDDRTASVSPRSLPLLRRFLRDARGTTAIEYALVAGLVFLAIVGALRLYADRVSAMYQRIGDAVARST